MMRRWTYSILAGAVAAALSLTAAPSNAASARFSGPDKTAVDAKVYKDRDTLDRGWEREDRDRIVQRGVRFHPAPKSASKSTVRREASLFNGPRRARPEPIAAGDVLAGGL